MSSSGILYAKKNPVRILELQTGVSRGFILFNTNYSRCVIM